MRCPRRWLAALGVGKHVPGPAPTGRGPPAAVRGSSVRLREPRGPSPCARALGVASPGFPLSAGSDAGQPRSRSRPLRRSRTPLYGDCRPRKRADWPPREPGPAPPLLRVGKGRRRLASLSGSACPCKQRPRAGWFGEAAGGGVQGDPWAPEEEGGLGGSEAHGEGLQGGR